MSDKENDSLRQIINTRVDLLCGRMADFGMQTSKSLFLINGASAVAIFTLISQALLSDSLRIIPALAPTLIPFLVGCVFSIIVQASAYFNFDKASNSFFYKEGSEEKKRNNKHMDITFYSALAFAILSALCFIGGVIYASRILLDLATK